MSKQPKNSADDSTMALIRPADGKSDPMSLLLDSLDLSCRAAGESTFSGDWGMLISKVGPRFYLITQGSCWFTAEGQQSIEVRAGHLVLILRDLPHRFQSSQGAPLVTLDPFDSSEGRLSASTSETRYGSAPVTRIAGGVVCLATQGTHPLHDLLADCSVIDTQAKSVGMLADLASTFGRQRIEDGIQGTLSVSNRIAAILYMEAVRVSLLVRSPDTTGWLSGIRDPEIGPVFAAMLRHPARSWTLESLAAVGMISRSKFAKRFRDILGATPMECLMGIRMRLASVLLYRQDLSIKEIAWKSGYKSDSAFGLAFKRWHGTSPLEFRSDHKRKNTEN